MTEQKASFFVALQAKLQPSKDGARFIRGDSPQQIFPLGAIKAIDGRELFVGPEETRALTENFGADGKRFAVTYAHGKDTSKGSRAAGYVNHLAPNEAGVWASEIDWTKTAASEIDAGEWSGISAEVYGPTDKEGRLRPRRLSCITLTNIPAIRGMATVQLAAEDNEAAPTRPHAGKEKRMKKFAALLGLAETASDEDIEKALTTKLEADKAAAEKLEAEKKAASDESKGVIEELTASVKEFRSLKEELAKLQADRKSERVAKAIATAKAEGKFNKDNEAHLVKLATSDVETFESILPTLAVVAPVVKRISSGPSGVKLEDVPSGEPEDINAKLAKLNAIADDHGITLSEARQFLEVAA